MKELIANGAVNWGTLLDVEYEDTAINKTQSETPES